METRIFFYLESPNKKYAVYDGLNATLGPDKFFVFLLRWWP